MLDKTNFCMAYILCCFLLTSLLMQFVVSSAFCDHCCVFMRVSSWWRAVSVQVFMLEGNTINHRLGLLPRCLSTVLHSHPISPSCLYDRQLREGPSNYFPLEKKTALPFYTLKNQPTFELKAKFPPTAQHVLADVKL